MKNFMFFLLIGGLTALCSCSKSEQKTTEDLLIGKWNITSLIDMDGDQLVDNTDPETKTTVTLEFAADGTAKIELKYTETATGDSETETSVGTFLFENENSVKISLRDVDDETSISVLKGVPNVSEKFLSADFLATSPDGDGNIKMTGERI